VAVRSLSGRHVLGNWKMRLPGNTWRQALACIVVLAAVAAWLQRQAPHADTFAAAVRTMMKNGKG
jgi:hypothetical protein